MKTWEETIEYIRSQPSFTTLVEKAYLDSDLSLNIERFIKSEEFKETLEIVRSNSPDGTRLLDIGSGNGISAVAFALSGFSVTAVEPNPSETVGAGAIRNLVKYFNLDNLTVVESFAEDLALSHDGFDVIYARQCLHHAYDLPKFMQVLGRLAKRGAIFISTRDHVVFDERDKEWFLASHPLQKYYGGENAFTLAEYKGAIEGGGFRISKQLGHYESVINYFPMSKKERESLVSCKQENYKRKLEQRFRFLALFPGLAGIIMNLRGLNASNILSEKRVPGRLYTFVGIKL